LENAAKKRFTACEKQSRDAGLGRIFLCPAAASSLEQVNLAACNEIADFDGITLHL
jgi:hypothetical protein